MGNLPALDDQIRALESVLGPVLRIGNLRPLKQDKILRGHIAGLNRLPPSFLAKLRRNGLEGVRIGEGGVSDFLGYEYLAEKEAPGTGHTWNTIRGLFDDSAKVILLGNAPMGIRDTAIHEIGHAAGYLLGYNEDIRIRSIYEKVLQNLPAFYKDDGAPSARGCREFFAEAFRVGIISKERVEVGSLPEIVDIILDEVLQGRPPRVRL